MPSARPSPVVGRLGRRLLARRTGVHGAWSLATSVAERRRPKLLPAATRLARAHEGPRAARASVREARSAPGAAAEQRPPGMSEFAYRWMFGDGMVEGIPFVPGVEVARSVDDRVERPAFLDQPPEIEAPAGEADEPRRPTEVRRGRVEEVSAFRLSPTPPPPPSGDPPPVEPAAGAPAEPRREEPPSAAPEPGLDPAETEEPVASPASAAPSPPEPPPSAEPAPGPVEAAASPPGAAPVPSPAPAPPVRVARVERSQPALPRPVLRPARTPSATVWERQPAPPAAAPAEPASPTLPARRGLLRRMLDAVRPAGRAPERVERPEPEPPAAPAEERGEVTSSPQRIAARAALEVPRAAGEAASADAPGSEKDEAPDAPEPVVGTSAEAPDASEPPAARDAPESPDTLARTPALEEPEAVPEGRPPVRPAEPRAETPGAVTRLARRVLSRSRAPRGAEPPPAPSEEASPTSAGPETTRPRADDRGRAGTVEAARAPGERVERASGPTPAVRRIATRRPAARTPAPPPQRVEAPAPPGLPEIGPAGPGPSGVTVAPEAGATAPVARPPDAASAREPGAAPPRPALRLARPVSGAQAVARAARPARRGGATMTRPPIPDELGFSEGPSQASEAPPPEWPAPALATEPGAAAPALPPPVQAVSAWAGALVAREAAASAETAPAAGSAPAAEPTTTAPPAPTPPAAAAVPDVEEIAERVMETLRRELLTERERMGDLLGDLLQ